jgi:glycosyltransferase involved in cell wall biosynthesis
MPKSKPPYILYVSSFPPRGCGIATFTYDLTTAIDREFNPEVKSKIMALNVNGTSLYNYPNKVQWQINDQDINDYLAKADEINNSSEIKLVNIQHEYGLFGGDWGNYVIPFLEKIKKPKIITFHTILPRPRPDLKKITQDIIEKVDGVVVMTKTTKRMLHSTYKISKQKPVFVIPHGVQNVPYPSKSRAQKHLNLNGKIVLSSFGLLSQDKGIEYAIAAMPKIVEKYPDVIYLVLGVTHPNVVRHEGEKYRNSLIRLVKKLKLEEHVKFYNKYMTLSEKVQFLQATNIYISPTLNPKQAVSGTVSDALSCACPIVVTKSQYAKDVVEKTRGILVGFANSEEISNAVLSILDDREMAKEMQKDAYYYSRHMTWQNVALSYFKSFNQFAKIIPQDPDKVPIMNLAHIRHLTDDFGMIQFAKHTKPDKHSGYCLDDNARAMLGCVRYYHTHPSVSLLVMIEKYLQYIEFSQKPDGRFYDFINHNRTINEEQSESQDSFGRALWSLGILMDSDLKPELIERGRTMLEKAQVIAGELKFSRAIAFALLGFCSARNYYKKNNKQIELAEVDVHIKNLADKLLERYREKIVEGEKTWMWFDDHLTYSNYKIPQSLFLAYQALQDKNYLEVAEESINWLSGVAFSKECYNAIGQDGWYFRNGKRAYFDQQPEDAASATEALSTAYAITKKKSYAQQARDAFAWFLGRNHLRQMMYDEATGGCYDGLGRHSINFNQGAESTLAYFLARLSINDILKRS